ncbi:MAG: hypothetical protein P4M11_03265 [Candidatus Pacebacteria bacterium]|nr:hypothetical protein [Candidatus Paceibacterota bacterium]
MQFLAGVVIPLSFNNGVSITSNTTSDDENTDHFVNGMNYMCGLRFTLKRAKLEENPNQNSKQAMPYIRKDSYGNAEKTYDSEDTSPFGTSTVYYYTKKNSYNGKGGYVQFFPGSMFLGDAEDYMSEMIANKWFVSSQTISLTMELMFYNANYGAVAYYAVSFLLSSGGSIGYTSKIRSGVPQIFDSFQSGASLGLLYAIEVIFQLFMYFDLLKILLRFTYHTIDLFTGKKIFIPNNDYIAVLTIAFALASRIFWYTIILGKKYPQPF